VFDPAARLLNENTSGIFAATGCAIPDPGPRGGRP
jgi:hypothetical protein